MHEMHTVAIYDSGGLSVCQAVCLSRGFKRLRCANTAERNPAWGGDWSSQSQRMISL